MQHSLAEEARRPRQSSFGALSAGLVERGMVPPEVLFGGVEPRTETDAADGAEASPGSIATAEFLAERAEWHARLPAHKLLSEAQGRAERTRKRESSFGALGAGMVERGGALSRQILSQAQIELLLSPNTVEHEELLSLAAEDDGAEAPAEVAADAGDAAEPAAPAVAAESSGAAPQSLLLIPQEPPKPIPTPQDFYRAAIADEEPVETAALPPARGRFRFVGIGAACLLLLLVTLPAPTPAPMPTPAVATLDTMPAPEPPPAAAISDVAEPEQEAANPPTPTAAPAIEAAEDEAPRQPTVTMDMERARPGPAPDAPMPAISLPPPPEPPVPNGL